jgi:dipeptidyl aminopeptidase/acylaminoacyl peptidase
LRKLRSQRWVVFAKGSVVGPDHVLDYLGRYTHRVAISNGRLRSLDHNARNVTFAYKDYADGSRIKVLAGALDRDIADAQWSSDSRTLYYLADDRGATRVYSARSDGSVRQVTNAPQRLRGFSLADNGRAVAVRSVASAPAEVIAFPVDVPGSPVKLAAANEALLAERVLGAVEELHYQSDGKTIQGWLVKPPASGVPVPGAWAGSITSTSIDT